MLLYLPDNMSLGKDLPVLYELIQFTMNIYTDSTCANVGLSCPVVTWAHARARLQPLPDLHDSLLQGESKGVL